MYLVVLWRTVIETPGQDAVLDENGVEITPAVPEVTRDEVGKMLFIDSDERAAEYALSADVDVFLLEANANRQVVQSRKLRQRAGGPVDVVKSYNVIEDDAGQEVSRVEIV